jgi:hypothetical protein
MQAPGGFVIDAGKKFRSPEISAQLNEAGIPGIKYLDQGSRAHWANDAYVTKPDAQGLFGINGAGITESFASKEAAQAALDKAIASSPPSSNYVVFDDKLIDIIKKYGMAGLSMMPPATAAFMANRIKPVDHDPFEEGAGRLVPVDHDPFAEQL